MSEKRRPRLGSMFSGYGGLDLAITHVTGAETVFVADICKFDLKTGTAGHYDPHRAPCSILAHRFPHAPNLGDVSQIDWSEFRNNAIADGEVMPDEASAVDILCAGFP